METQFTVRADTRDIRVTDVSELLAQEFAQAHAVRGPERINLEQLGRDQYGAVAVSGTGKAWVFESALSRREIRALLERFAGGGLSAIELDPDLEMGAGFLRPHLRWLLVMVYAAIGMGILGMVGYSVYAGAIAIR